MILGEEFMNHKEVYQNMRKHNENISNFAMSDEKAYRFVEETEDIRPSFFRDIDRIIYSKAYTRYMDKTQVFSYKQNDHITKRMVHVQLVSKIARTIGRALSLNEDLIEAAALGHDLGHVPFGHVGETILNKISMEHGEGYFHHNIQSVRMLMEVENQGQGYNLTVQVLDAIMCHNGEFVCKEYQPRKKDIQDFLQEYQASYHDSSIIKKLVPMTLEGCVVRVSDMIAYLGRDIEDACTLGVFHKKDIPKEIVDVLGLDNREIINTIIMDLVTNSLHKNSLCMSEEVYQMMKQLKSFNMEHIYKKANDEKKWCSYEDMFLVVFDACMKEKSLENKDSYLYRDFLNHQSENYLKNNTDARIVIDFIAGMTDNYLLQVYSYYKNEKNG